MSDQEWSAIRERFRLSSRELQIVIGLLCDEREDAIATRLRISPHTAHTYLRRLYQKLQVSSRVGLAVRVFVSVREMNQAGGLGCRLKK